MDIKVTADQVKDGKYIGPSLAHVDGSIEFAADLGMVFVEGGIHASARIVALAGSGIETGEGIRAGWGIQAGLGIEAGEGIEAGWRIQAGEGIKAGWGIQAGLGITARFVVVTLRIFAGMCAWRLPTPEECEIRAEIRGGTVGHGTVVVPPAKTPEQKPA